MKPSTYEDAYRDLFSAVSEAILILQEAQMQTVLPFLREAKPGKEQKQPPESK